MAGHSRSPGVLPGSLNSLIVPILRIFQRSTLHTWCNNVWVFIYLFITFTTQVCIFAHTCKCQFDITWDYEEWKHASSLRLCMGGIFLRYWAMYVTTLIVIFMTSGHFSNQLNRRLALILGQVRNTVYSKPNQTLLNFYENLNWTYPSIFPHTLSNVPLHSLYTYFSQ